MLTHSINDNNSLACLQALGHHAPPGDSSELSLASSCI